MTEGIKYRAILADPPWMETGGGKIRRGADAHYQVMKTRDIILLMKDVLADKVDTNAHLYLWVTNNFLPDGLLVMKELGFEYKTTITWMKYKPPMTVEDYLKIDPNNGNVPREVDLYRAGYTTQQIADYLNVCDWTVRYRLQKYGVILRPRGMSPNLERLTDRQLEILDGEMLGDGHISLQDRYSSASLSWHFKYFGHVELLADEFSELEPQYHRRYDGKDGYKLWTKSNPNLNTHHDRWYKDGIKILPSDLILTPLVCFHWYIGDGYRSKTGIIDLYTNNFTLTENQVLCTKLSQIGVSAKPVSKLYDSGIQYYLRLTKDSSDRFLEYIGPPRVTDYAYKWGDPDTVLTGRYENFSLGQYYRGITEHCLFGVKGVLPYKVVNDKRQQGMTGFTAPKTIHSEKPEEMYQMIEKVSYPPFLEMFARKSRNGWDSWGNELPPQT